MYKVYYTRWDGEVSAFTYGEDHMKEALNKSQELRNSGATFVTMVCENPNQVGKMGVDAVKDGVLPDGTPYTWMKRRTQ